MTAQRSTVEPPSPGATSFTVRGSRNGSLVQVTWTRDGLSGDFPTCDLIEVQAAIAGAGLADPAFAAHLAGIYGALPERPLADPVAAYHVTVRVFDTVREVTENTG